MGALSRFFCLSGGSSRRADWGSKYPEGYGTNHHSKVLQIIEEELDQRLGGASIAVQSLGSVPLRRMYNAGLPAQQVQLCKELLTKIAALDQAREVAEQEKTQLVQALKAVELAHRQAEFSRAKAEALATARGEALMHAQQATKEAQREQAQLSDMLKQTLQQLGVAMTPNSTAVTPNRMPGETPEGSMLTMDQPQLPSPHAVLPRHEQAASAAAMPGRGPAPPQPTALRHLAGPVAELRHSIDDPEGCTDLSPEFSGFTVYTNKLHDSVDMDLPPGGAASPPQQQRQQHRRRHHHSAPVEDSVDLRRSHVPWRDISSAMEASLSVDLGPGGGPRGAALPQQARVRPASASGQARAGDTLPQQPAEGAADPTGAGSSDASEEEQRAQFQRMARLVLPTLDASQLDSLVRVGASLPSPDMLMSPEVLQHLLPKIWDSSSNPLSSDGALDVEQLVAELKSQLPHRQPQQLQRGPRAKQPGTAAPARPSSSAGGTQPAVAAEGRPGKELRRSRTARTGTWLSPLKLGQQRCGEGEPTPSPQSHIKAVFKDGQDIQFYLPFSAGLQMPQNAAKEEYKSRTAQAAAVGSQPGSTASSPARLRPPSRQGQGQLSQSWDKSAQERQQPQRQQQPSCQQSESAAAGSSRAASLAGSSGSAREAAAPLQQPANRKQAFLSRFQPMGMHAAHQPAGEAVGSRPNSARSSVELSRPPSARELLQSARGVPADENVAGLRRQPSGEAWQQWQHKTYTEVGAAPGRAEPGWDRQHSGAGAKQAAGTAAAAGTALVDSTNAADSYLRRLAQQRVQQAYRLQ